MLKLDSLLLCPHQFENGLYHKELQLRMAEQKVFPESYVFGYSFEPNEDVIDSEYGNLVGIISAVSFDHAIIKHLEMIPPQLAMYVRKMEPVQIAVLKSSDVKEHHVMLDSCISFDEQSKSNDVAKYLFIPGFCDYLNSLTYYK